MLVERARMLAIVRDFFAQRQVLEVETPVRAAGGVTDVHLNSLQVAQGGWLQTSPEYHMKRLLAAGSGAIFQVFRAFRADESGRRHNPEFSLLEWYRPDFDHHQLMDEVAELVQAVLGPLPIEHCSYRDLFQRYLGIDAFAASDTALGQLAGDYSGLAPGDLDRDGALDVLLTHGIEPQLKPVPALFVHSYPASQAALARVDVVNGVRVAHRFELYVKGLELCNGYWELPDASEQRRRFEADNAQRRAMGLPVMPIDERFLAALEHGLPDCAGVALGLDRLLLLATGVASLEQVLAFPADRA